MKGIHKENKPTIKPIDNINFIIDSKKKKNSEARREYLREYYLRNKDRAREYQRKYNLSHKKKKRISPYDYIASREVIRRTFTTRDIMLSPTEKSLKILNMILKGERFFSM